VRTVRRPCWRAPAIRGETAPARTLPPRRAHSLDNNRAEMPSYRGSREKAFLFVHSEDAGKELALLYSLVVSCTRNDVNPSCTSRRLDRIDKTSTTTSPTCCPTGGDLREAPSRRSSTRSRQVGRSGRQVDARTVTHLLRSSEATSGHTSRLRKGSRSRRPDLMESRRRRRRGARNGLRAATPRP